jgi:DNA repair protein RadD
MTITLRPNQIDAVNAVENAYRAGVMRPLVDSCVGSGKSLTMAELARRNWARGERTIICAHTRELVQQNAEACRAMGLETGINAAALGERTWRAPVISAAIQSVYKNAEAFGLVPNLAVDECHLIPHSESGMYRKLCRDLGNPRMPGFSGTVFRLQGGSLVEGEGAPFEKVVYRYSIIDGIRDGYLVPAFSAPADDQVDRAKLRTEKGDYSGKSQDAQMIGLIDNHIAQMVHHGANRRAWLVFEASTKAAHAMAQRLNEWRVPTGIVLGETPAHERAATIAAYRAGRLRCLVNVQALTTGFDVQEVDMLVMRRRTMSLGLYIQMTGRLLRTIGGNIQASIAAGKADGIVLDFAGNIDEHGPLDFIRPKDTATRLASCDECKARNMPGATKCWRCNATMMKLCPACLESIPRQELDCSSCGHDMRQAAPGEATERKHKLFATPSGAALIASYKTGNERAGGWQPIMRIFGRAENEAIVMTADGAEHTVTGLLVDHARAARWIRLNESGAVEALLLPNGSSRTSALQVSADGSQLIVPLPAVQSEAA